MSYNYPFYNLVSAPPAHRFCVSTMFSLFLGLNHSELMYFPAENKPDALASLLSVPVNFRTQRTQ